MEIQFYYDRFIPTEFNLENILAIIFIIIGIGMVVALGKYGDKTREQAHA